jgi:hypothetical protein
MSELSDQLASAAPEIRDSPFITKHENLVGLATEHINAQSMIGRKGIIPPKEGDLADTNRFLTDIGRPETAADYKPTEGFEPPAEIGWTPEFMTGVNDLLHRSAVTQDQYPLLTEGYAKLIEQQREAVFAQNDADGKAKVAEMQTELGTAYNTHKEAGDEALHALYGEEGGNQLMHLKLEDGTELGNNWLFIKGLIALGMGGLEQGTGEDYTPVDKLGRGKVDAPLTPEAAKDEINAKLADKEFREEYFTANHPGHKVANDQMSALYAQAYPEGAS